MKYLTIFLCGLSIALADEVAVEEFTSGNQLFTAAAYKEIIKNGEETFLMSPFSVETALAFVQSGAKGQTAEEIRTSLYLPNTTEKVESASKTLLSTLPSNRLYKLHIADKIYVKDGFKIKEEFKRTASDVYQAGIENINFNQKTEAANKMNDWVKKETENKIQNLINPKSLNSATRLILINALYFKSNWSIGFRPSDTKKQNFSKTAEDIVQVDTMHSIASYKYRECGFLNVKYLEIPFEGDNASMTFILPNDRDGLKTLESQIEYVFVPHNLTWQFVNVSLPKFKIESEINLKAILKNLGVNKAFISGEADLSGIAGKKGDLFINQVAQKTYIDTNEAGVEAAAATYVGIGIYLNIIPLPILRVKEFIADHPFIFYIRVKGLIIFAGRVLAPSYQ